MEYSTLAFARQFMNRACVNYLDVAARLLFGDEKCRTKFLFSEFGALLNRLLISDTSKMRDYYGQLLVC